MIPTCLIGGIAALVLATSSAREVPVISIQYFGFHSAITVFAIYLLANKEIKFTVKDYRNVLIMLCVTFVVAIYLNSILYTAEYSIDDSGNLVKTYVDINFMYVVNPPQSNLPFLNKDHGWFVYIVHYAFLALFVVSLIYIKPIIIKIKSLFIKK